MIKWPEPVAILKGCNAGQWEIYPVRQMQTYEHNCAFYDLSQLKQAVRDAYEDAVQVCRKTCSAEDSMFGDGYNTGAYQCELNLRALIKEIE